jgi:hypothetical protein
MGKTTKSQGYLQTKNINGEMIQVGYLNIDKLVLGIRIKRSIGSRQQRDYNRVAAFLEEIRERKDKNLLDAIVSNPNIPLGEIVDWYYNQDKRSIPWDKSSLLLFPSMRKWLETTKKVVDRTKESYNGHIVRLYKFVNKDSHKVSDLPKILEKFREELGKEDKKILFNRVRATCLSFLSEELKDNHIVYTQTRQVPLFPKKEIRTKRDGKHITPVEIDNAFIKNKNDDIRQLIYFICITGIRPEEYVRHGFTIDKNSLSIRIHGEKTINADRTIPLVFLDYNTDNSHFGFTRDTLRQTIKRWLPDYTTQDFRRTFYSWCQQAGIDRDRTEYYFGHTGTMTARYGLSHHEHVKQYWVKQDSVKLGEWLKKYRRNLPKIDTKQLKLPRYVYDLEPSTAHMKKEDIVNHLNDYLSANHPGVFRKLYRVSKLDLVTDNKEI